MDAGELGDLIHRYIKKNNVTKMMREVSKLECIDEEIGWDSTALGIACGEQRFDCVKALLEAGANPNVEPFISIPLFEALPRWELPDIRIFRLLLDYGADPNTVETTDSILKHAMMLDCRFRRATLHKEAVIMLIERGALPYDDMDDSEVEFYSRVMEMILSCRICARLIARIDVVSSIPSVCIQDVNVLRLVAKHVWSTRLIRDNGKFFICLEK